MRKFTMALTAAAALTFVGGGFAHADDNGNYAPDTEATTETTVRDQGGPTTTKPVTTDPVTTTKLPALPTTGSDSTSSLQIGGVALLTGLGLVSVASVRRRKTA